MMWHMLYGKQPMTDRYDPCYIIREEELGLYQESITRSMQLCCFYTERQRPQSQPSYVSKLQQGRVVTKPGTKEMEMRKWKWETEMRKWKWETEMRKWK